MESRNSITKQDQTFYGANRGVFASNPFSELAIGQQYSFEKDVKAFSDVPGSDYGGGNQDPNCRMLCSPRHQESSWNGFSLDAQINSPTLQCDDFMAKSNGAWLDEVDDDAADIEPQRFNLTKGRRDDVPVALTPTETAKEIKVDDFFNTSNNANGQTDFFDQQQRQIEIDIDECIMDDTEIESPSQPTLQDHQKCKEMHHALSMPSKSPFTLNKEVTLINESTEMSFEDSEGTSMLKISREGRRLCYNKKQRSAAFNHNSTFLSCAANRVRKTDEQVQTLQLIFESHQGKITRKLRREAVKKTGLAWIQIYKWMFDRKARKTQMESSRSYQYPIQIFRVIGKDGRDLSKPRHIFKVERVQREPLVEETAGKLEVC